MGGEDVKAAKPSPEGLLLAIKRLHVSKAETLYIGDSTVDAETAQAAGVDFAGVTHGVTTAKELEKYPHQKIMNTLEELLAVQEEYPSIFKIENPIRPENAHATSPRKQKRISVWQILLLVTLFWLAIEELDMTDDSNFFPVVFILTLWGILQKRRILPNKSKNFHRLMVAPLRSTLTRISHQADTREKNSSRWQRNLHLPELWHHLYPATTVTVADKAVTLHAIG